MIPFESRDGGAVRAIDSQRSSMLDQHAAMMAAKDAVIGNEDDNFWLTLEAMVVNMVREELDRRAAEADAAKRRYQPTVRHCVELSAAEFNVSVTDIMSIRRHKPVSCARHTAYWLARRVTILSYPDIGLRFDRDHATIWHGVQRTDERRLADHDFREQTDRMLSLFAEPV